ncbi:MULTISPECIES: MOSC domain-containing protein [Roseobacteraceae]|uniref:Putative metal-sulfur cluster biosynthesis proteins YuaD n=1 Tax=Pseudosulfitobacter pseudonitzschiae TaxID=1402135 RepID=A0A221K1Y1_9RHOB|nr:MULTISPECIES: MOSC domain-containing protein [Roseobacteraceae]ASM72994.1 putative metal-sulfur cluster biosynthesis proteins YuaD [Pseudosulfitobacter pseudonitzschiae]
MPALIPTSFTARITWLGRNTNPADSSIAGALRSEPLESVAVTLEGFEGEVHSGFSRPSCSRVTSQHPKGTEIGNARQVTILSAEELAQIAQKMGVDAIDPALLGASMIVEGIPDFSHIPPSSRLQGPSGATLVVDMENRPCILPGREIETQMPGFGKRFKPAARNLRGVTGWVERAGSFAVGDTLVLHIPDQPVWKHLAEARR